MNFIGVVGEEEKPKSFELGDLVSIDKSHGLYLVIKYIAQGNTRYRLQDLAGDGFFTERESLANLYNYVVGSYNVTIYPATVYGIQLKKLSGEIKSNGS